MARFGEGQDVWLIIPRKWPPPWSLVCWFPKKVSYFWVLRSLDQIENPILLTANEMPLSPGNAQHPGDMSQNALEGTGGSFSLKLWQALSVFSQRIGGGEILFPFMTF